ncbi:TPA: hypothetical protein NQE78_002611 [Klebsiella pneumoniae]|uniref:hypothetical protein n=1 Tax=Klebsiella TaxID=570 RepID=UPI000E2B7F3B|nr:MULTISPECIES: hypothetical protein [Klebsiella]SXB46014.1 Uncharacterised protein [Klebsiella pneumoniae]SXB78964.1 Uncharacterised protein [Klebsiella pneumoniae]HCI8111433.1 hypothetical protein [Klebsiella pneumoniae]HCI9585829.1 hypothetical protein [Klebsiella pneumoniae]
MTTNITELALRLKLEAHRAVSNFNPQMNIKTRDLKELVEALENSESRLHEVAVACATAEQALEKAQQRIDELENDEVRQRLANAERQLYMAELAKNNLRASRKAQFRKRKAAEQRIAELESRTVTVKLPDDEDGQAYGFGKWAYGKLPATAGTMTIAYCEDAWRAAFEVFSSAAGIKVEVE